MCVPVVYPTVTPARKLGRDLPVEAGGEAADIVGCRPAGGAGAGPGAASAPPQAPIRRREGLAGDRAGFRQRHAAGLPGGARTDAAAADLEGEVVHESWALCTMELEKAE